MPIANIYYDAFLLLSNLIPRYILAFNQETRQCRAKFTRSARRTVYLYARPKVETSRDYQISITAEP